MKIATIVGARPQFIKAAPLSRALRKAGHRERLIHTGQHYDDAMSRQFFEALEIPQPDVNLAVGSGSHGQMTGQMLARLEELFSEDRPDAILVFGDTNSTLAGALTGVKLDIPVTHVEAGERIFRRDRNPEEINRVLTDHAAWLNLTATERARRYLIREGMPPERVRFVGDPMYDVFRWAVDQELHLRQSTVTPETFGLTEGAFHLATLHRVENTDRPDHLKALLTALDRASKPVLLPMHPRIRKLIAAIGFEPRGSLRLIEPQGYFEFMRLQLACDKVITDSGGVSKESFFARKACIIPLESSWWTDLVESGWAVETGSDPERFYEAIETHTPPAECPEGLFGDGHAAERIVQELEADFSERSTDGPWHPLGHAHTFPARAERGGRFTLAAYRDLLQGLSRSGYRFAAFPEVKDLLESDAPFTVLRHDVDLSLEAALDLAKLESELGVRSTYFFLLRTTHYNLLSKEGSDIVGQILALGHSLGLHFDCEAYPDATSIPVLQAACAREAELLEQWFGQEVSIVSYHRPSQLVLSGSPDLSAPRPHTYMAPFTRDMTYLSDSQGRWRFGHPLETEAFRARRPLHLLVHPIWWGERALSPLDTLSQLVQERHGQFERSVASNCQPFRVGYLAEAR